MKWKLVRILKTAPLSQSHYAESQLISGGGLISKYTLINDV